MIVTSTLWGESKEVKILFVTMLAMKDRNGKVTGTTAGLSRAAVLTYEETVEALKILEAPDTKSDTNQEYEGRRIKRVEGGWVVLNADKYRGLIEEKRRRDYQAGWQAEQRKIRKALAEGVELREEQLSGAGWKRYQRMRRDGGGDKKQTGEMSLEELERWVERGEVPEARGRKGMVDDVEAGI